MAKGKNDSEGVRFNTKKCYDCLTHLPLDANVCYFCKKKVGKVDRNGIAEKPTDIKAYAIAAAAFLALIVFLWKAFLQ